MQVEDTTGPRGDPATRRRLSAEIGPDGVRALLARSDRPGMIRLALHLGLLVAGTVLIAVAQGTWWIVPVWIADGTVLAHLFALQHETAHGTAFVRRRTNRVISATCGAVLGIAPTFFRWEHTAHHAWTQDAARDPEMIDVPSGLGRWMWFLAGGPFWSYQLRTLVLHALGRLSLDEQAFVPLTARRRVVTEARLMLLGWSAILVVPLVVGCDAVLVLWVVPRMVGEPVMRLARLSEHAGRPRTGDVTVNTRTLDVPVPLRVLAWNMPFHAEHHAMPAVPFHALPRLRVLLADHVDGPHGGYLAAQADILRRIRRADP